MVDHPAQARGLPARLRGLRPEALAALGDDAVERLLSDPGIVRHRGKIAATLANARCALAVAAEHGSLGAYLWSFVGDAPIVGRWATSAEIPSETAESRALSRDLKRRGFRFVGPTTCYALMQAAGMVNDHVAGCFRLEELAGPPQAVSSPSAQA